QRRRRREEEEEEDEEENEEEEDEEEEDKEEEDEEEEDEEEDDEEHEEEEDEVEDEEDEEEKKKKEKKMKMKKEMEKEKEKEEGRRKEGEGRRRKKEKKEKDKEEGGGRRRRKKEKEEGEGKGRRRWKEKEEGEGRRRRKEETEGGEGRRRRKEEKMPAQHLPIARPLSIYHIKTFTFIDIFYEDRDNGARVWHRAAMLTSPKQKISRQGGEETSSFLSNIKKIFTPFCTSSADSNKRLGGMNLPPPLAKKAYNEHLKQIEQAAKSNAEKIMKDAANRGDYEQKYHFKATEKRLGTALRKYKNDRKGKKLSDELLWDGNQRKQGGFECHRTHGAIFMKELEPTFACTDSCMRNRGCFQHCPGVRTMRALRAQDQVRLKSAAKKISAKYREKRRKLRAQRKAKVKNKRKRTTKDTRQ
ncbi:Hypothetical predicted protein, partial [Paramuricea clavata]